jgi:transposase
MGVSAVPKKVGRPTKITIEIQNEIVRAIRSGNYLETAASYVGLAHSTVRDWVRRGEREASRLEEDVDARPIKSETPFMEFSVAIKKAQAAAEIRDVIIIGDAARGTWQAAAWRLERKYPDRWGKRESHEISGPGGKPVQVEEVKQRLIQKFNSLNIISNSTVTEGELG